MPTVIKKHPRVTIAVTAPKRASEAWPTEETACSDSLVGVTTSGPTTGTVSAAPIVPLTKKLPITFTNKPRFYLRFYYIYGFQ